MIRTHGPANSTAKLCLFVINSFADDSGTAHPSQSAIAKAASLTEKTVQRVVAAMIDAGWLGAATHLMQGKKWKNYIYRCAVPDALQDTGTMQTEANQKLVDCFHAKHGPLSKGGRPLAKAATLSTLQGRQKSRRSPF
jgi:hypothetical protein